MSVTRLRTNSANMKEVKICVLGDVSVGKTCLAMRFVHNTFTMNPSTIGAAFLSKHVPIRKDLFKMNIWDTAGSERFRSLAPAYFRGAAIAVLVYDITSYDSFQALQWWVDTLEEQGPKNVILSIAGNKCDLEEQREVTEDEVKLYAESIEAIFVETSAKSGENVNYVFVEACKKLLDREEGRVNRDQTRGSMIQQDQSDGVIKVTNEQTPKQGGKKCCKT